MAFTTPESAVTVGVRQPSLPLTLQPHKLKQARQLYRDGVANNDSSLLAESDYVYGRAYYLAGDYLAAQRRFLKSLRIQEKRGDSYELGRVYIGCATSKWHSTILRSRCGMPISR